MTDAIAFAGSIAGLISGYVYHFVLSLAMGIASGDKDELIRVALSLFAVWLSFVVVLRSTKLIARIIRTTIKLALLTASFVVALHFYNRGFDAVSRDVHAWVRETLPDVATVSSVVSFYERVARQHILLAVDAAQDHVSAAFDHARNYF